MITNSQIFYKHERLNSLLYIIISLSFLFQGCNNNVISYEPNVYIKDWLIIGPFPNCEECSTISYHHDDRCKGFYKDYLQSIGGELNVIPTEGMKVQTPDGGKVNSWTQISSAEDKIKLTDLDPKDMVVAYAFCQIESPKKQKSILSVGSNDGILVFLNGEKIHESHEFNGRWLQPDNDYIPINLREGINNLLLKIDQGTGDFGFIARFLNYDSVTTQIRNNIKSYTTLKAVSISDTLVTSFGNPFKISVLNPDGKVKIKLSNENNEILNSRIIAPGEDARFLLEGIKDGFLTLTASFPTPNDGVLSSEIKYFNGKLKKHPNVQKVTKELTIIDAEGKPFFPIGTYGAPVEDYKILKDAGYNFVVASAENLDKVHEAGLLAAVPIHASDPNEYYEFISKHKSHPAVLCWMLYDEPGYNKADLLHIYDIYNAAYKADKIHPSYLVITTPSVYKSFGRCCDILAVDTYPITNGEIKEVGENISLAFNQLEKETPIWHCGQMFTWPEQRRPNSQEHRFMTYYALISGAKGALWYTYKGYGQYLPADDPELWNSHKNLLSELNELAPVFLEKGIGQIIRGNDNNDLITAIRKDSPIGTFLIVVNKSKTEMFNPSLIVGKKYNGEVKVYRENRKIKIENGILQDAFDPLAVHIYELDEKNVRVNL